MTRLTPDYFNTTTIDERVFDYPAVTWDETLAPLDPVRLQDCSITPVLCDSGEGRMYYTMVDGRRVDVCLSSANFQGEWYVLTNVKILGRLLFQFDDTPTFKQVRLCRAMTQPMVRDLLPKVIRFCWPEIVAHNHGKATPPIGLDHQPHPEDRPSEHRQRPAGGSIPSRTLGPGRPERPTPGHHWCLCHAGRGAVAGA
jgi:hypothetical protein